MHENDELGKNKNTTPTHALERVFFLGVEQIQQCDYWFRQTTYVFVYSEDERTHFDVP